MRMGQGVRTGLGHGGITCVLQTQFSSSFFFELKDRQGLFTKTGLFTKPLKIQIFDFLRLFYLRVSVMSI